VPYVLLAVTCTLAVLAAVYAASTAEYRRQAAFLADADETRQQIQVRLNTYLDLVRAGTALLAASNEVNHAEFRAFVRRLEVRERYPGIEGVGFAQHVARQDLGSFVRDLELDGVQLRLRPTGDRPASETIVFLEPIDSRNQESLGFDLSTDPVQLAAMARARDTGHPALSDRVRGGSPVAAIAEDSVVLYVPVYRTGAPTATVDERRRALHGFVFSSLRIERLLQRIAAARPVTFEVYDGPNAAPDALIHASAMPTSRPAYEAAGAFRIAERQWLIVVKSTAQRSLLVPAASRNALLAGALLSVLVFLITRIQIGAWETTKRHEIALRESEQALRASEAQLRELVVRERDARAQAEAADKAKDDFLVALSHELRTPLNAVLGWITILRNESSHEDRRLHAVDVIERNARLQAHLIEDLLDVQRILLGKMTVKLEPVAMATVVGSVLDSVRPAAETAGVELSSTTINAGLIRGDAPRVHQIVWNLVSNAIKFTPPGGRVTLELTKDGGQVELRVRDTGVGIAPEFLPHVFERFRQADSASARSHSGLGLGLAITRHLVEMHGGSIAAHSDGPERGALFIVRLPAAPVPAGADDIARLAYVRDVDEAAAYGTATPFAS
jgi:signal transduction histidine kinase